MPPVSESRFRFRKGGTLGRPEGRVETVSAGVILMTKYALPDLPYDYGALEPHISARIMELHHDKHHRKHVDTGNETIEKLLASRKKPDFAAIAALEQKLACNVSGHVLHSIFWQNL